ncbi:hypothetical protein [Streptomyces sp. NPDC004296]|uniref:hypothetical protein n=1 Tax=Streptomyces sp. NPDC004296 TaxID=3364697 RepID=UPI0036806ADE
MSRTGAEGAYLGWQLLQHAASCTRPAWVIDTKTTRGYRDRLPGESQHGCPDVDCGHTDWFEHTSVRILCRSCGTVRTFEGELHTLGGRLVENTGYGAAPTRAAGLWLYPGPPLVIGVGEEPYDHLVTREKVDRLAPHHVVGKIVRGRGPRGGTAYSAALQNPDTTGAARAYADRHGDIDLPWLAVSGELTFKTVTAAAKWIAARLEEHSGGTEAADS